MAERLKLCHNAHNCNFTLNGINGFNCKALIKT